MITPGPGGDAHGIYAGDCIDLLRQMDAGSVHCVVTSPPYNVGKGYDGHDDGMLLYDYLGWLRNVWAECYRVLIDGGRICVNVANTDRKPYVPLSAHITMQMLGLDYLMRGEIIWNKAASVGTSTAWGSFAKATNPVLRDVHEYIMIFSKGGYALKTGNSGISNQDFVEWTKSIWTFPTESAKRAGHPAPFPLELPHRLVSLYTGAGDVVLDPFVGSGTTTLAAHRLRRRYIGFDVSAEYAEMARQRIVADAPLLAMGGVVA